MAANEYGFPMPTGNEGRGLKQVTNVSLDISNLPARPKDRLEYVMALRVLSSTSRSVYGEETRGAIYSFHERIKEEYNAPWERVKETVQKPNTVARLTGELAKLEFNAAVARRAEALYAADVPLARRAIFAFSDLAMDAVRYVNRQRGEFIEVQDVDPGKKATVESIRAEMKAAEEKKQAVGLALPPLDVAMERLEAELNEKAAAPHVTIHPRMTPIQAPRELPPLMQIGITWPESGKLHAIAPGTQAFIEGPNALGIVVGLFKNEIAAKLRVELESKYAAHKQNGALILDDLVRARGLKDVEAEIASIHRKESFLFWKHVADNRGAPPAWTHTDMNIPALLGVK